MTIVKSKKRFLSIALAVVMIAALFLCGSAMAANNDRSASVSVTVIVQSVDASSVIHPVGSVSNFTVTVSGSSVTVYDVVNALAEDENYTIAFDPVWKDVSSGVNTAKALISLSNSITEDGLTETNVWGNHSYMVSDSVNGSYDGTDWIYYVNNVSSYNYMDQQAVSNGDVITLSYEENSFDW